MKTTVERLLCVVLLVFGCGCKPDEAQENSSRDSTMSGRIDSLETMVADLSAQLDLLNYPYIPDTVFFCGSRVPTEEWWVMQRLEEAIASFTRIRVNRQRIDVYLRELPLFFPYIDSMTAVRGLHQDLRYIPVVESEFNMTARSRAKAVGMWQFIGSAGKRGRLKMNAYVDERRDFERATTAALKKLSDEYPVFDDWFLTVAAYNAGVKRVKDAVHEQGESSYFDLILPSETMDYIYKLIAVKIILENPERYAFDRRSARNVVFDVVTYTVRGTTTLIKLAKQFGVSPLEFKLLNTQFLTNTVPPGTYELKIPQR